MLQGLCGEAEPRQESATQCVLPPRRPATLYGLHYLVEGQIHTAGVRGIGSLPTGVCTLKPKQTGKSREKEDRVLAESLFS